MIAWGIFLALLFLSVFAHQQWLARARQDQIDPAATERWFQRRTRFGVPAALLVTSAGATFSKLGGEPELPDETPWPSGSRQPCEFLAQVDLADVRGAADIAWLPDRGRLFVFHDADDLGSSILIHSLQAPAAPRPTPRGPLRRPERRVSFERSMSYPSDDWLNLYPRGVDDEAVDERISALSGRREAPGHRIGGYPDEIQGGCLRRECERVARGLRESDPDPAGREFELASRSWRLLFQIASDEELKFDFGDAGNLYIFIREADARSGDFSRTVTIFQGF